ncbi:deaminase [Micromonospora sp. NBC_01699]
MTLVPDGQIALCVLATLSLGPNVVLSSRPGTAAAGPTRATWPSRTAPSAAPAATVAARWAGRELAADTAAGTTMYTSCQPCNMCTGAIERSGLGRVVYALSTEQLLALKPSGGFPVVPHEGPSLPDEARIPVDGYYR